jgi:hypothetical protein
MRRITNLPGGRQDHRLRCRRPRNECALHAGGEQIFQCMRHGARSFAGSYQGERRVAEPFEPAMPVRSMNEPYGIDGTQGIAKNVADVETKLMEIRGQ